MESGVFVYRKGALGDTIFFYPFLFTLRKTYKKIYFAANYLYRDLFKGIDFIEFLDADSRLVFDLLRGKESIDKIERYYLFSQYNEKTKENYLIFPSLPQKGWVYSYPYECVGIEFVEEKILLPIFYREELFSQVKDRKFFLFHPGSGGMAKVWKLENFFALEDELRHCGFEVFYLLGEAETHLIKLLEDRKFFYNFSLNDIIFLLQYATSFVGSDSGIGHLAGLIGTKGFMLFGPTDVDTYRPYDGLDIIKVSDNVNDIKPAHILNKLGGLFEKR